MAPKTPSETIIIEMMKRPELTSDVTYIRRLAVAACIESIWLSRTMQYTKNCIHWNYAFKRERYPCRWSIHTDICEEHQLEFIPFILKLASLKTGKHQKKFKEEAEFLKDVVCVLANRTRKSKALSDMPARKCLFCCKLSKSDPFEYLQKFDFKINAQVEDETFYYGWTAMLWLFILSCNEKLFRFMFVVSTISCWCICEQ